MRKYGLIILMALLLSGCGSQETFETISDEVISPVMAQPREITVRLPDNAVAPVVDLDSRQIYMSEDYEITVETLSAGDLQATVETICGYDKDALTIIETKQDGISRYEFVWVSMGERGDRLGRAVILDDRQYHYCMSVLRDAASVEDTQTVWSDVFGSFALI